MYHELRKQGTRFGLAIAAATAILDQAIKLWLLFGYGLEHKGIVPLTPFVKLVLTWNFGISYGLFQQDTEFGRWMLVGIKIAAVVLLAIWLRRAETRLTAAALGLIIGGAIGNGIDRVVYGAVADFVLFQITTPSFHFSWYVFNLADAAIVAGVAGLLYESLLGRSAAKAP